MRVLSLFLALALAGAPGWSSEPAQAGMTAGACAWRDAVDVAWSPISHAESYAVYTSVVPGAAHGGVYVGSVGCATSTRLIYQPNAVPTYVAVLALDTSGQVVGEAEVVLTQSAAAAPITDLLVNEGAGKTVRLTWSAAGSTWYEVRRGYLGQFGAYDVLGFTSDLWWVDSVLGDGDSYWYEVEPYAP